MFPLSDSPNSTRTPFVTYLLIAVNVLVFLAFTLPMSGQQASPGDPRVTAYVSALRESLPPGVSLREVIGSISIYDLFVFEHGYKPGAPSLSDLLAAMFLHGGFMHLFGNMLFLWIYGDNVEHRLGPVKYLFWYLMTGVAATLFFSMLAPGSLVPMVGASGAISGVLGFYFWWFPRNVVRVLVLLFPIFVRVVEIPARIVLGIYLFIDNVLPMLIAGGGGGGGVAHGAHIGGFVGWPRRGVGAVLARSGWHAAGSIAPRLARSAARAASSHGRCRPATWPPRRVRTSPCPRHQAQGALDTGAVTCARCLARGATVTRRPQSTVYQRHVRQHPHGPGVAEAHVAAGVGVAAAPESTGPGVPALRRRTAAAAGPQVAAAARAGMAAIASMQKFPARRFTQ